MEEEEFEELEDVVDDGTLGAILYGPTVDKTDSCIYRKLKLKILAHID